MSEYVDRGKEYYDRGRTQWAQYVEKGKGLIQEHQDKVSAAIDAGKEAYVNTTHEFRFVGDLRWKGPGQLSHWSGLMIVG